MPDPLTRPLFDNRMLRATGGADLTVGLGTTLKSVFETPTLGELAAEGVRRSEAAFGGYSAAQLAERREKQAELRELSREYWNSPTSERDAIYERLNAIQKELDELPERQVEEALEAGRLKQPEALAEEYGELGLRFDRPMTGEEARMLADDKRAEIIREALIEKGPRGVLPGAAKFGAGLAALAVDPLEVATAFIPVVGQAGRLVAAARFGRIGGRSAVGVTEGAIGNLLTEPFYYGLSRSQQLDYDMADALLNVGLGAVFGGGLGAAAGVATRRRPDLGDAAAVDAVPDIELPQNRELAEIALRQFVNDQRITVGDILSGRDLLATTAISRGADVSFPAQSAAFPRGSEVAARPSYLMENSQGAVVRYRTVQQADVAAGRVNGKVLRTPDGFVIRRPAEGTFEYHPDGTLRTFANQRAAEKYVSRTEKTVGADRDIVPIRVDGRRMFAVSRNMSPDDLRAIANEASRVEIPPGKNTRAVNRLPGAEERITEIARRLAGRNYDAILRNMTPDQVEQNRAEYLARQARDVSNDPAADVQAADEMARPMPENFVEDDIEHYGAMIRQIEDTLTEDERAFLGDLDEIDARADAYAETAEAAALCVARTR